MSVILKAENISKQYRLGTVGTGTLSHDLNRWWHQIRGKEDPYLKVGAVNDRSAKASEDYVWALRDINFEVKPGEVLGIIGKNGAGKSTLLKLLSRVTSPTTGSIKTKGRIASLLEVGTGFHPELTGRENIFLNGAILGMTKPEIKSKIDEIIAFSGCEMYIDTPVKRYSSGMRVRLGFAVAAHLEPEILVVDEVLAVGDAEFQKKAIGKMQDLSSGEGRTVLFVSHNMASVQNLCTRGIVLENGKEKLNGDIEFCIREYLMSGNSYKGVSILENEKRLGGNDFRFTGVKYEDFYNNEIITPQSGMNLKIKIFFNCVKNFKNVEIRLQFKDSNGYIVATLNNYHTDFLFDFDKGNNIVVCNIFNIPFIKGNYLLNLRAVDFSKKKILDEVNECERVTIESGDFFSTGKLPTVKQGVLINHNWENCG
ncbi:ABC transporter ATP-binding protein [Zunongwangia sp.]|uniref:ABC transporter ATP-binding protein n=1 Tax=Zunongwangia sp. TaxID=1965325 RepID=UPI003AA84B0C